MNTTSSVVRGARLWWRNTGGVLAIAAVTWIPVYAIQAVAGLALDVSGRMAAVVSSVRAGHAPEANAVYALAAYELLALLLMVVGVALVQGALIAAFAAAERGAPVDIGASYRVARRRAPAFVGALALVALIVLLAEAILYIVGVTIAAAAGSSVLLVTIVFLVGSVLPLLVAAPFAVAPQVVVLENASPLEALRGSRRLMRGRYWRALGLLFLLSLLGWIASAVLGLPVRVAGSGVLFVLVNAVMAAAGAILVGPVIVATLTALYFSAGGAGAAARSGLEPEPGQPPTGTAREARLSAIRGRKRLVLAFASLLLIAAGGNNNAIAINTTNNSTDIKVAFKIVRANGDIVAPVNFAFAYASCTSCETAAIAIEVVFVTSTDASVVSPVNEAWAVNYACTNCQTLADAYQFTVTTGGQVHFTPEGNKDIAQIRRQLQEIAHSDMTLPETVNAVQALADQLQQVLATDVVTSGNSGHDAQAPASPQASPSGSPASQSSPSSSPSASPQSSPSPTQNGSPTPSPSPSP